MLRTRVISGVVLILLLIGMFFIGKLWFYLLLAVVTAWGIREIWLVNRNKHQTKIYFCLYFILPALYLFSSLFWVVGKLKWESNIWWLISALIGTSAYDILAYFIGKSIGKNKITPKTSPNKTWEGTIGGFLGPILTVAIVGKYFLFLAWFEMVIFALMIGVLAFWGDLMVSWYKRKLGVKDIGHIIPGHGGLLDRIDSHLLVFLGVFCFQAII